MGRNTCATSFIQKDGFSGALDNTVELHLSGRWLSGSAWHLGEICLESTELICHEIAGCQINYSTGL